MSNWLGRITTKNVPPAATSSVQTPSSALSPNIGHPRDPNAPNTTLTVNQKCIYERRLPGEAYITAHVQRLQAGFYDSPLTHEDTIENVRFVAISFVFHPAHNSHRFTSAQISIALHSDVDDPHFHPGFDLKRPFRRTNPKFLRHAPHLLYGSISPETLNWNFNVAGSLGVSQTPVTASLAPSGGMRGSYKFYDMMRIQGSIRALRSWRGREYDLEDGELVWTLEENALQKSGLPREFTFIMLCTKGDAENVLFDVDIDPTVSSWFGHYPRWYTSLLPYQPIHTEDMDLDTELGQRFEPTVRNKGYNFANMMTNFDDFVFMPGTTYSASVSPVFATADTVLTNYCRTIYHTEILPPFYNHRVDQANQVDHNSLDNNIRQLQIQPHPLPTKSACESTLKVCEVEHQILNLLHPITVKRAFQ